MAPCRAKLSCSGRSHQSWLRCPNTTPMRRASARRSRTGSSPHTRARPAVGTSTPVSILIVVDLPAPFGPRKPTASPAAMVSVTPSTAVTRFRRATTNVLVRPSVSTITTPSPGSGAPRCARRSAATPTMAAATSGEQ